jgi:branched-subunit amino acid ABC-type transport system permease component
LIDILNQLLDGVPTGCVYGLVAVGLVLTYKTSGVFNFAFGAQAFTSAVVFYICVRDHNWPLVPAAFFAIVVVSLALGLVLDQFIFKLLRTSPQLPKLVTTIGLMVGIPETVKAIFGGSTRNAPPSLAVGHGWHIASLSINADGVVTLVATFFVVIALTVLFRWTPIGLRMRAVVESHRLVELNGINAEHVSTFSWLLSSLLAGMAGVLLAPLFTVVDSNNFTLLIVAASAAAVFAGLSSIPLALVGGIVLGALQQLLAYHLPLNSVLAKNIRPSMPFILLAVLLLVRPGLRRQDVTDPLSGVDPPPPALAVTYMDPRLAKINRLLFLAFVTAVAIGVLFLLPGLWVSYLAEGLALTTIFLSITVLVGIGGQISLCQASFAGLGAFTAGQLATRWDFPLYGGIIVGAIVAAALGVLIALPCLRLGGLYLALGTLAFALMLQNTLFVEPWLTGSEGGVDVPRPLIGPIDFADDRAFFFFALAIFGLCGFAVVLLRRGTTGQYLAALRGSEVAATSVGINPIRAKVTVFAVSAAIAGAGGALYASYLETARVDDFNAIQGLFWVLLVVTLGSRTVDGALNAGMAFVLLPPLLGDILHVPSDLVVPIQFALFGFGAVTFARHQEGIVEYQKRASIERFNARLTRWFGPAKTRGAAPAPPGAPPAPAAAGP